MAEITVKAFAELIHTPLFGQLRILREHKFPNRADAPFKIPYYKPALRHIRDFYSADNDFSQIPSRTAEIKNCGKQEARLAHNLRALRRFRSGSQAKRTLAIRSSTTFAHIVNGVRLKATADLTCVEDGTSLPLYLLYQCRELAPEEEIIRTTVELFHWVLQHNGCECSPIDIEYVCVEDDRVYRWKTVRKRTLTRAVETTKAIDALWDSLSP